jgi:hypothetical protein
MHACQRGETDIKALSDATYHWGLQFQVLGSAFIVEAEKERTGTPRPLRDLEERKSLQLLLHHDAKITFG